MISIPSFAPSASKPHDKDAKREQNPRYTRYNGLSFFSPLSQTRATLNRRLRPPFSSLGAFVGLFLNSYHLFR